MIADVAFTYTPYMFFFLPLDTLRWLLMLSLKNDYFK